MLTHDVYFTSWRKRELARLAGADIVYADYTGSALYPESLIEWDSERLRTTILGNPHSTHAASIKATDDLEQARRAILDFLHASPDEYSVVLTSNASAACRIVGESFPFEKGATFLCSQDNHNSINGIGEFARRAGADVLRIPLDAELRLPTEDTLHQLDQRATARSLFAFPAQSNFSGVQHELALIDEARSRGWHVLLDAASFLSTCDLRLDEVHPDFVVMSIYKIIGYPSGVGALVARHEALEQLQRPWFAGGTVDWVSPRQGRHRFSRGVERFEDGTPSFLSAGATARALCTSRSSGREWLRPHSLALTALTLEGMARARHANGAPVVIVYGPRSIDRRGSTVAFNLLDSNGQPIPFWIVEERARSYRVAVRGGCFCNPGCAESAFGLDPERMSICLDRLDGHFDIPALASCLESGAVGAVRVSYGLGSIRADVERIIELIRSFQDE